MIIALLILILITLIAIYRRIYMIYESINKSAYYMGLMYGVMTKQNQEYIKLAEQFKNQERTKH
jgi:uncharacterized membrane protein